MGKSNTNNKSDKTSSYTEFYYHFFRNILLVGIPLVIISAIVLSSLHISATSSSSGTDQIQFSLSVSCTMSGIVDEAHTKAITNGTYHSDVGKTTVTALCNDGNGYAVYANGYSNNEEGNNKLINSEYPEFSIDTGLNTSGLTSAWAMKLNNLENDPSSTPPTIETPYNDTYGLVPKYWTKVVSKAPGTINMDEGSSFTTTYAIYTTSNQQAGIYNGQVKYVLTHPSYQPYVYYMQEVDKWKNTIAMGESVEAIDQRDGKKYWVTRLEDNNIWMTSNLDLDIGGANTAPLNSNNTDISTDPSVYTSNGIYSDYNVSDGVYTWNPASTAITANRTISGASVSNWANNATAPYSAEGDDIYYYTSNSSSNDTTYNSLTNCTQNGHTEGECKHYHRGNYYNWTAAIASNNSSGFNTQYDNASNSICPKNWRLPVATNSDQSTYEFGDLLYTHYSITQAKYNTSSITGSVNYTSDGFVNIRKSPLWFVRSGNVAYGTLNDEAVGSLYWSSTVIDSTNGYTLYFNSSGVWPFTGRGYGRRYGRSIRCVAR